jgi:hypothetical protein
MKIRHEEIYTKGKSFRAFAEAKARQYRANELKLSNYDIYGHILTDVDSKNGMNFLPSLRKEIYGEVLNRDEKGKGVDIDRTTKNMLSSQAMCFNLFVPLNRHKRLATSFFQRLIGDVLEITKDIEYEFTPSNSIFRDQSGRGGVDCDALLTYINKDGKHSLLVIETKFVEREFSICGFRKSNQKDPCPLETNVLSDFSNCRYHFKKGYNYWKVSDESNVFNMKVIQRNACPFGGYLWQLWTNLSLAYALAHEKGYDDFSYAVICPDENDKLLDNGKTFKEFRKLLNDPDRFKVIYLSDIMKAFESIEPDFPGNGWIKEFTNRYCTK